MATKIGSGISNLTNNEFLTFTLGSEEYGIDILKVQEIRGYDAVTRIANTPTFIKGVINLRGSIILNLGKRVMGIVVDSVSDVLTLSSAQISPTPELSAALDTRYILGLGTVDQRMLILVDIEKLMSSSEMALMDSTA
jgi:purine-binding chemotaxis protein CheW